MCCDGTLHLRAALDEDERDKFAACGLKAVELDNRPYLILPCPRLDVTFCSIYSARPKVCCNYRCKLLRGVAAGEMAVADAIGHIDTVRALRATAESIVPGVRTSRLRRLARAKNAEQLKDGSGAGRAVAATRLLPMIALDEYLARWFRVGKDQAPTRVEKA